MGRRTDGQVMAKICQTVSRVLSYLQAISPTNDPHAHDILAQYKEQVSKLISLGSGLSCKCWCRALPPPPPVLQPT